MIQRKQTIYLLISVILTGTMFFIPLAKFVNTTGNYVLNLRGIYSTNATGANSLEMGTYPLIILAGLATLISIITIALYKKRVLQIRLCGINTALLAGLTGFVFYFGHTISKAIEATVSYELCVVFPLIALVLNILALIAIGKDEALIKSLNRIR